MGKAPLPCLKKKSMFLQIEFQKKYEEISVNMFDFVKLREISQIFGYS